jgi:hypothetical protein
MKLSAETQSAQRKAVPHCRAFEVLHLTVNSWFSSIPLWALCPSVVPTAFFLRLKDVRHKRGK